MLILTVSKTLNSIRAGNVGGIVRTFFLDGIMYYRCVFHILQTKDPLTFDKFLSVIFSVNLVLAVMLVAAPVSVTWYIAVATRASSSRIGRHQGHCGAVSDSVLLWHLCLTELLRFEQL